MQFFKRLEIHGFKSFAHRTVIEFQPGVTVVVGPNGCGKSNVFDSIRWVLGEQSARSLRGSRMGDIIFNGSGGMKPLGMARVELVLNNQARTLPVEFDEVSIARRLFRTGESEYHLNKTQGRLRDITTLLMDTGIGTDSYSVMEQGKVDGIINAKPMERRAIFDEAAGISKYKARKDEALGKLRRTDDDLVRLADLINEVRRQAGSLKRQANKAEKYKELSAELRRLEMESLARRWFQFRQAGAAGEAAWKELHDKAERLRAALAETHAAEEAGRGASDEASGQFEALQTAAFELAGELQDAQGRAALLDQRRGDGAERRGALEREIATQEALAAELESGRAAMEREIEAQDAAVAALRTAQEERRAKFEALKTDGDAGTGEMARLRAAMQGAGRVRAEQDNRARVARAMEEKLASDSALGAAELTLLREQDDRASADATLRGSEAAAAAEALQLAAEALAQAKQNLAAKETVTAGTAAEYEAVRRETQQTASRHEAMSDLQESFEGYYRGVKEVMTAGKRGDLPGLVGVVSALVEAKKEHETAIEVALGGQAQDIVVESADDGKRAIRWLKEARVGRATFLPLDLIEARETRDELRRLTASGSEPGVVGLATDLVKFNPRLKRVVQFLLGNVVVVRDIDVAVGLQRRGIRTKYVTLDGEMVAQSGAMTGGSLKATGLLNRTREVKELGERLGALKGREADLAKRAAALKAELEAARAARETTLRTNQAAEIEFARARKDAEVAEQRLGERRAALAKARDRHEGLGAELETLRATQAEASAAEAAAAAELATLEEALSAVEATATAKQAEVQHAARAMQEGEVELATLSERLNSLRERHGAGAREGVRLAAAATERRAEIGRLGEAADAATAELEALRGKIAELEAKKAALDAQLTEEGKRREGAQAGLRQLAERANALQRDFNEARNELHEAELRRTESSVQLDNIAVQAGEKFGLTLAELVARALDPDAFPDDIPTEGQGQLKLRLGAAEQAAADAAALATARTIAAAAAAAGDAPIAADQSHPGEPSEETAADPAPDTDGEGVVEAPAPPPAFPDPMSHDVTGALARLRAAEVVTARLGEVRGGLDELGPVHLGAIDEYAEASGRFDFLTAQEKDLNDAKGQLAEAIAKIDGTTRELFTKAFTEIRANFEQVYRRLFGGGRADLLLTEENGVLESGIDIVAQPPGKRPTHISLLSGGEKALTAVALLFAIFLRKPSPFCILDEIDAPLDDKNIERFKELVREFALTTQFIIITHNKQTMALANTIYGVTMQEQGVSRVVSLKLDEITDDGGIATGAGRTAEVAG